MTRRNAMFGLALLLTLLASWWAAGLGTEAEVSAPARPAGGSGVDRSRAADPAAQLFARIEAARVELPRLEGGPFAERSFQPPPPPPTAAPAVAPRAPALPFRYIGALEEDGVRSVFLANGDRLIAVRAGDLVDGTYKVERLAPGMIEFTYLPLKERQLLPLQPSS
jgi:hypothetical protein